MTGVKDRTQELDPTSGPDLSQHPDRTGSDHPDHPDHPDVRLWVYSRIRGCLRATVCVFALDQIQTAAAAGRSAAHVLLTVREGFLGIQNEAREAKQSAERSPLQTA